MTPDHQAPPTLHHRALPPRQAAVGKPPLLVLLHGRGDDETDLLPLAALLDPRFAVVSPRAPFPLGFGAHWYDLLRVGDPEPDTFARSLAALRRFLDEAVARSGADPGQVYLLGFSQGAVMSGALTLTEPDRVAGAVLLSGYLPLRAGLEIAADGLRGKPVFAAHGTADAVIPVGFGRETETFLTAAAADLTYREYPTDHRIAEDELADIAAWLTARLDANSEIPAPPAGRGA